MFQKRGKPWNIGGNGFSSLPEISVANYIFQNFSYLLATRYLEQLLDYLSGYIGRIQPLLDQVYTSLLIFDFVVM